MNWLVVWVPPREKGVVEAALVGVGQGHVFFHDLLRYRIDGYLIVLVRLTGKRAHQLGRGHQLGAGKQSRKIAILLLRRRTSVSPAFCSLERIPS